MLKAFSLAVIFFSYVSHARELTYDESNVCTYLRGNMALTNTQKYAFEPGFTNAVIFPNTLGANQSYSAEVGFGIQSKRVNVRLGVELLSPVQISQTVGTDTTGNTPYLYVTSQIFSVIPKVSIEYSLKQSAGFKFYFGGSGGYAITDIKNTVTMTSAGTSTFGKTDYTEEGSGYGISVEGFTGVEFALFDNVGFSLDAGYRYLLNNLFTAVRNANTVGGNETVGQTLTNFGGGNRFVNLTGYFAAATFRIYIR